MLKKEALLGTSNRLSVPSDHRAGVKAVTDTPTIDFSQTVKLHEQY